MTEFRSQLGHERYEELCALATAGVLTAAESELLTAHLESCAECREAFAQYQSLATDGMPFLASHFSASSDEDEFDENAALCRLMHTIEERPKPDSQPVPLAVVAHGKPSWNQVSNRSWMRGLAAASLVAGIGAGAYWMGTQSVVPHSNRVSAIPQTILPQISAERQALEKTIQADSQRIASLEQQTTADKKDMEKLHVEIAADGEHFSTAADAMNAAKRDSDAQVAALIAERDVNANKLHDAESRFQTVQDELNTLRYQHQQDLVHLASLETRINSLNADLNDQDKRTKTDEQYLASDKDIRDLIGARNLYIADIIDVNSSGQSRKPFGRVFYTKTKSLIFYAYDLDRQPGMKQASTFQVWGRTGTSDRKPINLGILYMDSEMNRRWTLRVDNPEQLARLDSVFVTVEPHEQTDRPTGKPFLYASLRRDPNHP